MQVDLYEHNTPDRFWRLLIDPPPSRGEWEEATRRAAAILPPAVRTQGDDMHRLLAMTLGEGQFGPRHWDPGAAQRFYYLVKPAIPQRLTRRLRQAYGRHRARALQMHWPIEPRYARFQLGLICHLLRITGHASFPFLDFWPAGRSYALVLTHDIESAVGQRFVPAVAALEEGLGFRSSFNFVPERYPLDRGLMEELRARGFEVGVHGLRHDGKLFSEQRQFLRRAARINSYMRDFGAVGFRAPLTQRQPEWMQALDIEYDSSFFDTDPYEPVPGGTMSIWPYQIGRWVELPYTLVQDHTLAFILRETTPRLWLEKVAFLRSMHGMALVLTHPDYLRSPHTWRIYADFLRIMRERGDFYHALPMEVARWWRARATAKGLEELPAGTVAEVSEVGVDDLAAIRVA
jgi:hypothetical protein